MTNRPFSLRGRLSLSIISFLLMAYCIFAFSRQDPSPPALYSHPDVVGPQRSAVCGSARDSTTLPSDGSSQEFWSEMDRKGKLATYDFDTSQVCYDEVLYDLNFFYNSSGPWHFMTRAFTSSDEAAIDVAREVSESVFTSLSEVADSTLGLTGHTLPPNGSMNHCRHLMMLTMLFSVMPNPTTDLSFLEIGGGYANMARIVGSARLTRPFHRWTIFDMRHSMMVQDWFLRKSLPDVKVRNTLNLGDDMSSIERFFSATGSAQTGKFYWSKRDISTALPYILQAVMY